MLRNILKIKPWLSSAEHRNELFFIENNRSTFPLEKMSQVDISPSHYYRWRRDPLSNRERKCEIIKKLIRELFASHPGSASWMTEMKFVTTTIDVNGAEERPDHEY